MTFLKLNSTFLRWFYKNRIWKQVFKDGFQKIIFENPSIPIYCLMSELSHPSHTTLPSLTNKKPKKGTTITLAKSEEAKAQVAVMIGAVEPQSFPNLKDVVNFMPKKKKRTTIMLSEFNHGGFD